MSRIGIGVMCLTLALLTSACAEKSMYYWGAYSSNLNNYYKNPGEREKFIEKLHKDLEKAEQKNKVPPGIYAEYGYMMLETGATDQAVIYFGKERDKWPESNILMTKLIDRLAKAPAPPPADSSELKSE